MKYRLGIAEDKLQLADALKEKLSFFDKEFELEFMVSNGKKLMDQLEVDHNLDLILMDIKMPIMDGIEATARVKKLYPHIKIVMITVFDDDDNIIRSIQSGASGYLLKESTADQIRNGIIDVMNGDAAMTPSVAMRAMRILASADITATDQENEEIRLSKRELQVLEQLSSGLGYQAIAENLIIAPRTVRKHIENIYTKLQVHNKIEAIDKAKRNRLI